MNNSNEVELASESLEIQCSPLSMVMAEERPITVDEACALRLLLFGNLNTSFSDNWTKQGFHFRRIPSYGILQKKAGPCGVLAAVQAFVLRHLIFRKDVDIRQNLKISEKREALANALASIQWQAGEHKKGIVAIKHEDIVLESAIASSILEPDGLLEYVHIKHFDCRACLIDYYLNFVSTMMSDDTSSCILFLYSVIFSHGIQRIKEEMDYPESHLIGRDGYCSQEVINLMLVGKAVANLFDGDMELNSGGSETSIHRGIPDKSKIGLLSLYEYQETCTVGYNYKNPIYPIWLLLGQSHFTVLFSMTRDILMEERPNKSYTFYHYDGLALRHAEAHIIIDILMEERPNKSYTFYHYDGLALRHAETHIIIDPFYYNFPPIKDPTKAVYLRCIYTRWPFANIQVKDDSDCSSTDVKIMGI